jgi:hypothetical protein
MSQADSPRSQLVITYDQYRLLGYKIIPEDAIIHSHRRKNIKFYIKTQFVPHRRHITSPLQSPAG